MIFFRVLRHLLPNSRAWRLTIDRALKRFFEGLANSLRASRLFIDGVWSDLFPNTTRDLDAWEDQFGLPGANISEADRRDRLAAAWKAVGGQDPEYIQATLRARGFDVYVHEWWTPGTEPAVGVKSCATPRNPVQSLGRESSPGRVVACGEPRAQCGEIFAQGKAVVTGAGYPLVNKTTETTPDLEPLCGEPDAECGEEIAECGYYTAFVDARLAHIIPTDPDKWAYFLYIGGETFGTLATVPSTRRNEFEDLCLKICPAQLWLGILVRYE